MKKLLFIVMIGFIAVSFSSCQSYHFVSGSSSGCGVWYPKKFEKDRSIGRFRNRANPNSAYNRIGRGW